MKLIIAGTRTLCPSPQEIRDALASWDFMHDKKVTSVLSGQASGVDQAGERWASLDGIPVELYPADWQKHGRKAGPMRNSVMADKADALLAFHDGVSRGTADMIRKMRALNKPVRLVIKRSV